MIAQRDIAAVAEVLERHWPVPPPPLAEPPLARSRHRWAIEDAAKAVIERLEELGWSDEEEWGW